jgi:tRNA 2-(methylsulfanyl)-N6-isopentenyladenosine37 hydroxylase
VYPAADVLHLASRSDERFGPWAVDHLDEVLVDHAHLERKAATTALAVVARWPEATALIGPLCALAREELEHFELVCAHLQRRGVALRRQRPAPYAAALMQACRNDEPARRLDTLICCGLIEARSCERMLLLRDALARRADAPDGDVALVELYGSLLASEARHHATYLELAQACGHARAEITARLGELAAHEAAVIAAAPAVPRLHNTPPPA